MQHVIYSGPYTAVVLDDGTTAYRGVPVEVSEDKAAALLRQAHWSEAAPPVPEDFWDDDGDDNDDTSADDADDDNPTEV